MTDQALDNLARRVMRDAARLEYGSLIEELPEHDFSPEFERKMKKLLRQGRHPVGYRTLRAAACLLLVLFLSGCAVLAISPEARETFVGWVREISESWFIYHFTGKNQPIAEDVVYRPTWIPEGYVLTTKDTNYYVYENDKNELLSFFYSTDLDSSTLYLETEAVDVYSVSVGDYTADLYLDRQEGDTNNLVWEGDMGVIFWISAPLTSEELIEVAESVEAVNLVYSLGWVPEGYEWFDSHCDIPEIIKYRNQDGDMLLLSINKGNESIKLQVQPTEGDLYKQISVSGVPADLYLNTIGGNSILIWMDEEDGLVFVLNGPLTEEELIQVAEHVKKSAIRTAPHRPGWIPEGYVYHGYGGGGASFEIRYDRDGSESIWFRYGENSELQEELREELKDLTPESIQMNGQPALLYTDVDSNQHLIWSGTKLGSDYWLSGPLDIEELIQIAMSVGKTQE